MESMQLKVVTIIEEDCNMGKITIEGDKVVYRQDDGEITAWLTDFEEKMELAHEGSPLIQEYLLPAGRWQAALPGLMIFILF